MRTLTLLGVTAAFYPAAVAPVLRWDDGAVVLVTFGILSVIGAAANFVLILLSHVSIGWGAGHARASQTWAAIGIPAFQLAVAVFSIAAGVSDGFRRWASGG